MIIFVGDKPSVKNKDPNVPFVGTQSYKRLLEWIWQMDIDISNVKTMNANNPDSEVKAFKYFWGKRTFREITWNKYVALGNKAYNTLIAHKVPEEQIFKLPHPSGRNRKINDKKYVNKVLKECRGWLNG